MSIEATYCPEDNKIRLYCGWVDRELYERLRDAGYKPTPKQDCDFVATWHFKSEDIALELIDEGDDIGDEDQSPEDRAADRAERFAMYRDKRRAEAAGHADTFDAGPSAFGHQNARRAERAASRHDRHRMRAVSQWDKAEYWQRRTEGVIDHALHRADAHTRRGRIVRLEKELAQAESLALRWKAYDPEHEKNERAARLVRHLQNRLAYERQMLAADGGAATDHEIKPGGHFGHYQVLAVHKSRTTGKAVSVTVLAASPYHRGDGPAPLTRQKLNIQRLAADTYRPPTPEDLEQLKRTRAEQKTKTQAANAGKPKLINPTPEDAERLQSHLNARAAALFAENPNRHASNAHAPSEVVYMTQAAYSARSRGSYGPCDTYELKEDGGLDLRTNMYNSRSKLGTLAKVRGMMGSGWHSAPRVVCITDKPQKPLPDWDAQAAAAHGLDPATGYGVRT